MHWQIGGNLEPVQMVCELDWRECPKAIANYIWREIVTDVLDCLRNESVVWRVLALFLVSFLLLRIVRSKEKFIDDKKTDNSDVLNKVGYKVEDLELKVNILTYKLQYGNWPLPHEVRKSNFRKNLRNLRLTLSNPNDRNNWIKHVLLSPRKNESFVSYSKYCPSEYRLTELFDAKKRSPMYPFLLQENVPMEHSSRSSRTSSEKSLKLSPVSKNLNRKQRGASRNENPEVQYRNAISLPLFSKRSNRKARRKSCQSSKCIENGKDTVACEKFTKTMDDCKRYLRQLHDSNKNLGLVCSSSDVSEASVPNFSSDARQRTYIKQNCLDNVNDIRQEDVEEECNEDREEIEKNKEQSLELSNAIYPVIKLIDKRLIPSSMNLTFCPDMLSQQSASDLLIPKSYDRKKFMQSSRETLYQVRKRLESLHNVLRVYELQNEGPKAAESQKQNSGQVNNICQNDVDVLDSVATEINRWCKNKSSKVYINNVKAREMQRASSNSSELYDSDETGRSSVVSIQNYSNLFNARWVNNINEPHHSFGSKSDFRLSSSNDCELGLLQNNRVLHLASVKYEKIPERVYYALSSDSSDERNINKERRVVPDLYVQSNRRKPPLSLSEQYQTLMDTDEDVVMSPRSSQTEASKDSELEDKPTALLLQEALKFKQALLTRVELENIYYIDNKTGEIRMENTSDHDKYSYLNSNLQTKILDIISEEQSVISSSTEKTSRTYMVFNLKPDRQFNNNVLNFAQQNKIDEIEKQHSSREYLDSKQNLASVSEYFSFSNIAGEETNDKNQISLPQRDQFLESESTEVIPDSLQLKYLNDSLSKSDENLEFMSCTNARESSVNQRNTSHVSQKESFGDHFMRMNNINEFIYQRINSVELFSQNLDEPVLEKGVENLSRNDACNSVTSEALGQYSKPQYSENTEDVLNAQINTWDVKHTECQQDTTASPNLTLKRNPGACSLLHHKQSTNLVQGNVMQDVIEGKAEIYELSPCESKETSLETNLIQDSLASSINNSNDSNIPEPPSVTALINRSTDEEKLDLNRASRKNDSSDDCINVNDVNDHTDVTSNQNKIPRQEAHESVGKGSCAPLVSAESAKETELYKSRSNLISPNSSMYFTDEASSTAMKSNNTCSRNSEGYSDSNIQIQREEEAKECNKTDNYRKSVPIGIESCTAMSKECKETMFYETMSTVVPEQTSTESHSNKKGKKDVSSLRACTEDKNISPRSEMNTSKNPNDTLYNDVSIFYNTADKSSSLSAENKSEKLNMNQYIIWSHNSPRQYCPRGVLENKTAKREKFKSHKNETPRTKNLTRPDAQQVKDLMSDNLNVIQTEGESKRKSARTKKRYLSAESRCNKEDDIKVDRKRSRSQISLRTTESSKQDSSQSLEPSEMTKAPNYTQLRETKSKLKGLFKSLEPTPKTSSRSCIPILKSRLEAARKAENESRPKSPVRGPLTMTMFCRENLCEKNENVELDTQVEGKLTNDALCSENLDNYTEIVAENHKENSAKACNQTLSTIPQGNNTTPREQMVIYVNIFTKYNDNTTKIVDPNKFLEYIRNKNTLLKSIKNTEGKEVTGENVILEDVAAGNIDNSTHNVVTVVSSVLNGNELKQTISTSSSVKTQNDSIANTLFHGKLKNMCLLSVEHREIDVTAKPSVIDTSTSISDLEHVTGQPRSLLNKFQITGTPKELNNEEYIALVEILNQEPNTVHLQELQNVCKTLVSERRRST